MLPYIVQLQLLERAIVVGSIKQFAKQVVYTSLDKGCLDKLWKVRLEAMYCYIRAYIFLP